MKRFFINLFLIVSVLSILVIPSFAATTSDSDEIVILKQPTDVIVNSVDGVAHIELSVVALNVDSFQWQVSNDNKIWSDVTNTDTAFTHNLRMNFLLSDIRYFRCKLIDSAGNYIFTRVVSVIESPANIINFVSSSIRYITTYISLIINSLITPGAPLYALLPILSIGIAVAVLLIVIKITKYFSWGM